MVDDCCPICQARPLAEKFKRGDFRYVACPACGHAHLSPLPEAADACSIYNDSYFLASETGGYDDYLQDEPLHRVNARERLKRLTRLGSSSGRLLDIGCAAGFFLEEARRAGWQAWGVDCSPWARSVAAEKFDLTVFPTVEAAARSGGGEFQAVTMFQVLEHLPDPLSALLAVAESLAVGGALVIETWDRESLVARLCGGNWQQITPPSVVHLFSRRSLRPLVESCGFENVTIRRTGKRVSVGFVGNLLHKKHPRLLAPVGWVSSRRGIRDFSVRYALGDLITLTATKGRRT